MNPESITNATIRGSADGSSKRCLGLNRSCTAVSKGFTNGAAGAVSSGSTASKSASCVVCYDPCDDAPVLECGHKHCGACLDSILRLSMGRYRYCCGVCRRPLLKRVTEVTDMLERGQLRSEPINFSDAGQVMEALRLLASVIDTAAQFITHVGVRPRLEVMVHSLIGLSYHKAGSHTNALGVLEPLFPLPVGCVGTHTATADVKRSVRDMVSSVAGGGTGDGASPRGRGRRPGAHSDPDPSTSPVRKQIRVTTATEQDRGPNREDRYCRMPSPVPPRRATQDPPGLAPLRPPGALDFNRPRRSQETAPSAGQDVLEGTKRSN